MRITLSFNDRYAGQTTSDLREVTKALDIPDNVFGQPDFMERLRPVLNAIGQLTAASLHVTCKPIGLNEYPVKIRDSTKDLFNELTGFRILVLRFWALSTTTKRLQKCDIRIVAPIHAPQQLVLAARRHGNTKTLTDRHLIGYTLPQSPNSDTLEQGYICHIDSLVRAMETLLNYPPTNERLGLGWGFRGFHPQWTEYGEIKRARKRLRAMDAEQKREKRRQVRLKAKLDTARAAPLAAPKTGAGRTHGARPGIYKGVQMRSQLEIRFAAELDERGYEWVYEGETLGESGYLVDFYLPKLMTWIEVKGRIEARDRQVLPDVARMLKQERGHNLLMYTSSGPCYRINPTGFREIDRASFWDELLR